jgi:hypothetical protein
MIDLSVGRQLSGLFTYLIVTGPGVGNGVGLFCVGDDVGPPV